jgi:cysteine synthase A
MNILDAIGNTSMVQLRKVVPTGCADIFVKLEWENPTGSLKDRMARTVIERAAADGGAEARRHRRRVTGGSRGVAALVCAKGYRIGS